MAFDPDKDLRARCAAEAVSALKSVGACLCHNAVAQIAERLYRAANPNFTLPQDLESEARFAVLADQIVSGEAR